MWLVPCLAAPGAVGLGKCQVLVLHKVPVHVTGVRVVWDKEGVWEAAVRNQKGVAWPKTGFS